MPLYRLQCSWQMDTSFPRDAMVITPHFDDKGALTDPQNLTDDLAAALDTWTTAATQITVKAYRALDPPPQFPVAETIVSPGVYAASTVNRDIALCLSFYAGLNRPRQRGRIYVPLAPRGISAGGPRPTLTQRQVIAELVPIFESLGGADVDWVVYSRADGQARKVTNWWIDDAWDTQRRRGLPATQRLEGTTSG